MPDFDLILRYFNYTIYSQLPLNCKFTRNSRSITSYDSRWHYSYIAKKTKQDVALLQVIIPPDVQAQDEETHVGPIDVQAQDEETHVGRLQGPIPKNRYIDTYNPLEQQPADFVGPLNIDYWLQRVKAFEFSNIILIHKRFPHTITWAAASNTTRGLWENYSENCESLIEVIQRLPLNYEQLVVIRELTFKLEEAFGFFDRRRQLEALQAQVTSKTRSGKRCR